MINVLLIFCHECLIRCVLLHLLCMLLRCCIHLCVKCIKLSQSFVHCGDENVSSINVLFFYHDVAYRFLFASICKNPRYTFFCPSYRSCKTFISDVSAHLRPFCNTPFVANKPCGPHRLELRIKQHSFAFMCGACGE